MVKGQQRNEDKKHLMPQTNNQIQVQQLESKTDDSPIPAGKTTLEPLSNEAPCAKKSKPKAEQDNIFYSSSTIQVVARSKNMLTDGMKLESQATKNQQEKVSTVQIQQGLDDPVDYFCCVFCSRLFREYGRYERHLLGHSKSRPFACPICSKQFSHEISLSAHSTTHSKNRPHLCTICGKGFTQKGNLQIHYRIHTGEKPYTCDYCHKSFRQRSTLTQHKRTHTGEPEYKCLTCMKEFLQLTNYQHHRCINSNTQNS